MFIEIEDLKPEPLRVHHVFQATEIGFSHEDTALAEPVTADFTLEHKGSDLRIKGTVETAIRFRCCRCNKECDRNIAAGFALSYLPQPEWAGDNAEVELKYEDMDVAFYDGIAFDVNLMVLEQIELAIPMKLVCREDCKGLCYRCGADLNEGSCSCTGETADPRLSALLQFRKKSDK
ncbi:MAG: DUF177 domain-containing protein [Acidobacteria bacterium]|nr:DUF177 domain-containing protein [Acidobacteriota bacterium]